MEEFKRTISDLQMDTIHIVQQQSRMVGMETQSESIVAKAVEDYLCELESLCVRSRNVLDRYGYKTPLNSSLGSGRDSLNTAGEIEVTHDGWVKITLNTLLPNCRHRISGYIGDTIGKLIGNCNEELPFFETAFMAIVEYCNNEKHIALDNDNKGWKMIPNALKGRIIEDDNQFILSVGLFTKISDDLKCEVYIMPPDEGNIFMELLAQDML